MTNTTDAVQTGFLNGVAEFNGVSSESLADKFIEQMVKLEQRAQAANDAVMMRQIRQVIRASDDSTLKDTLRKSFDDIKSITQSTIDSQIDNVAKTADIMKKLGKGAAVVDAVLTANKVVNSVMDGDYAQAGEDLGSSIAAGLIGGAVAAAIVTTFALTGGVALSVGIVAAGAAAALVTLLLPDLIDAMSDALADFFTWWDPEGLLDDTFTPPPSDLGTPPPTPGSPIVLDLDGDGIETVGLSADIHFDHDGDGFKELSGFTNADDGLLALDRNNDGVINNGSELFGSFTALDDGSLAQNGFEALKEFDLNADGVINSDDAIYSDLRVFKDLDQDGQTDAGELLTLTEAGVESLALDYTNQTYIDAAGNDHRQVGSYTNASGEVLGATDVWFARNLTDTEETTIEVSAEIAALPDAVEVDCFFSKAAA